MARLLGNPRPYLNPPQQAKPLAGPCHLVLRHTTVLPFGRCETLLVLRRRPSPPPPHRDLRLRPPDSQLLRPHRQEQILAQCPEVDNKQLLLHAHLHPLSASQPFPHRLLVQIQKPSCLPQERLRPLNGQARLCQPSALLPHPLHLQGPGLVQELYETPSSVYLHLNLLDKDLIPNSKKTPPS